MKADREIDLDDAGIRLARSVFGDRTGVALFLGAVLFFALYWRIGIFSSDTYAVANTMANVADGRLYVGQVVYGPPSGVTPGMHVVEGRLYGRNFGMVFAGLPIVWLLEGLALFVDLRIALAGIWSLGLFGFLTLIGERVDLKDRAVIVGSVVALGLFALNVAVARPLPARWYPVIALQVVTMGAAGLTAVVLYRLLTRLYGGRIGVAAGVSAAVASPVGFWATFPKRHAVTAFFAVLTLYWLYRSRESTAHRTSLRFRALAYVPVGLTAWVHSAEGLVLLIALGLVDVATARWNRPLDIVVVGGALFVSLLPLFLTNYLIAGSPLQPPRLWESYGEVSQRTDGTAGGTPATTGSGSPSGTAAGGTATGGSSSSGSGGGGAGGTGIVGRVVGGLIAIGGDRVALLFSYMETSIGPLGNAERLSNTFLRSGYIQGLPRYNDRAINLSVLEAMPLFAGLAFLPAVTLEWARGRGGRDRVHAIWRWITEARTDPVRAIDAFAVIYLVLLVLLYMSRLPTHFMLTVRYLHPIYPIGLYFLARLPPIRRAVNQGGLRIAAGYGLTVAVGVPLYLGALWITGAILGEAVQLFALCSLVVGSIVAGWAVIATSRNGEGWRLAEAGAPVLGVAAGLVTVYLLVSGLGFFAYTHEYALPMSRVVAEQLLPINPLRSLF